MSLFQKLNFGEQNFMRRCSALLICTILAFLQLPTCSVCTSTCSVTSPAGTFQGFIKKSPLSPYVEFCNYLGIRYGRPPIGNNRFKESVLAEPLEEVQNANVDGSPCAQNFRGITVGSEDCLFLNVFTSDQKLENSRHTLKPVIVYIHGGGLILGGSLSDVYSPDFLMEHDVIVVTMNYRLHLFGFLSLGIPDCGGNMGLRDQVLALKWVQQNIRSFGGDPNNVTLMGESAGSWSSYLHLFSPKSRGLFGKVILQSPIATSFVKNFSEHRSLEFIKYVGYSGDIEDRLSALKYLKNISTAHLLKSLSLFSDKMYQTKISYNVEIAPFYPVIDSYLGEEAFFPQALEELGRRAPDIPIIVGQTSLDGSTFFLPWNSHENTETPMLTNNRYDSESSGNQFEKSNIFQDFFNTLPYLPALVEQSLFSTANKETIDRVKNNVEAYLDQRFTKDKDVEKRVVAKVIDFFFNQSSGNQLENAINLYADLQYYKFYEQLSLLNTSYYKGKIYVYQFCYDGSFNMIKVAAFGLKDSLTLQGMAHAEDISYTFYPRILYPIFFPTEDDKKIIRQFCKMLTNFAKFGDPNSDDVGIEDKWEPMTLDMKGHLRVDVETRFMKTRINENRRQFWDNLTCSMN